MYVNHGCIQQPLIYMLYTANRTFLRNAHYLFRYYVLLCLLTWIFSKLPTMAKWNVNFADLSLNTNLLIQHTTNLRVYLTTKHPEQLTPEQKAKVPKIQDYFTTGQSSLPNLSGLDRQAIAACCAKHVLPFDIVEDPIFQWSYNCQVKSRRRISDRVSELAKDWRIKINDALNGKFVTVLLDGWINQINKKWKIWWIWDRIFPKLFQIFHFIEHWQIL